MFTNGVPPRSGNDNNDSYSVKSLSQQRVRYKTLVDTKTNKMFLYTMIFCLRRSNQR